MTPRIVLVSLAVLASTAFAGAQPSADPSTPAAASASPIEAMEDPRTGDHWSYEVRDDISGELKSTVIQTVTDVSATDINIRLSFINSPNTGFLTFDRSWNLKNSGLWRYNPTDGSGIVQPLAVGKTWSIKSDDVNTSANANFRRTGSSKVTAKESVTTSAGTFDAYKIETSIQGVNPKDPGRKFQILQTTWYAPEIDHWVKRSAETRSGGQVRDKTVMELVEYGRR